MQLTSFLFLLFFPIVFLAHWLAFSKNAKMQNCFLLIASCIFYGWWDWRFLGLLLFTGVSTYCAGLLMDRYIGQDNIRKTINTICIILNIGILFAFKYFNFFIEAFEDICQLIGVEMPMSALKIILPVGISFYTFSALSYSIDVCQRKVKAVDDIWQYLAYATFFPSILSGPVNRATKQLPQFMNLRKFDYEKAAEASKLIVWGLFVKLCVADRLGIYVDTVYNNMAQHTGLTLLLATIVYTIQIYADFAGYSLIAIGTGGLLGIDLQNNFMRPYFATTVTDFWRRWHISLTTWFRDYVYFPLGGNRCSHARWIFNTMVVFIVSGLWHGAAYTFLIWGAFHGLCMVVEKQIYGEKIKQLDTYLPKLNGLRMLATFAVVNFAWVCFRLGSVQDVGYVLTQIVTLGGGNSLFFDATTLTLGFASCLIMLCKDIADERGWQIKLLHSNNSIVSGLTIVLLLSYTLLFGVLNGGSFIYFQF